MISGIGETKSDTRYLYLESGLKDSPWRLKKEEGNEELKSVMQLI